MNPIVQNGSLNGAGAPALAVQGLPQAGFNPGGMPSQGMQEGEPSRSLGEYIDIFLDNLGLIACTTLLVGMGGLAYALLATPIYESNIILQVEDSTAGSAKAIFGEASSLFEGKAQAAAEIELIRSRLILNKTVEKSRLHTEITPRYLPLVGRFLASRSNALSAPIGGYVHGAERIETRYLEVPKAFYGLPLTIEALAEPAVGAYRLTLDGRAETVVGSVGKALELPTAAGPIKLLVTRLEAEPGAQFIAVRRSVEAITAGLQKNLVVKEKTKNSGVIEVSYRSADPVLLAQVLNEIGRGYLDQNLARKSQEASKSLEFLQTQLPIFKAELQRAETEYNGFRNKRGTVDVELEGKAYFEQYVQAQGKLQELQQKKLELETRYTRSHPSVKAIDAQIANLRDFSGGFDRKVKSLPNLQQDGMRLKRDVEVNTQLYKGMLDNAMQLRLMKEGKVGSSRLVDEAIVPLSPVAPLKAVIAGGAAGLGLLLGVLLTVLRSSLFGRIRDSSEIERDLGLNVYGIIPLSPAQAVLAGNVQKKMAGRHVLAHMHPHDSAIESLRSFRVSLQFAMLDARNNVVLFTGPTAGIGKSFLAVNFAAVMAASGKRVLLIDGDMRKGIINRTLGFSREGGLSELISGTVSSEAAVHRDVFPGLDFVSTGRPPPNPAELVVSAQFNQLIEKWSAEYDVVVLDSPPVLLTSDTAAMGSTAGLVFMVARADRTQLAELAQSVRQLNQGGVTVNGVLFNGMDMSKRRYSYGYGGGYGYGYRYRYNSSYITQIGAYAPRVVAAPGGPEGQPLQRMNDRSSPR